MKLNWDAALPHALIDEWKQITSDWKKLCGLHIPRYIGLSVDVYYDASVKAYAAAVYVRIVDKQLHFVKTSLIFSKLRLAPLGSKKHPNVEQGQVSLPRMELLAVLIGVRAIKFVTRELKLPIVKRMVFNVSYTGSNRPSNSLSLFRTELLKFERNRTLYLRTFHPHKILQILQQEV